MNAFLEFLVDTITVCSLPLVHMYYTLTTDFVLNTSAENAAGLEKIANEILIPYQFVFAGRKAIPTEEGRWQFEPRFIPDDTYWTKEALSLAALPASFVLGGTLKAFSLLSKESSERLASMRQFYQSTSIRPLKELYASLGIEFDAFPKHFESQGVPRRPEDLMRLREAKECLADITRLLNAAEIPWWLDCGSCLGAYRHGGVIPYDTDIDIAVLLPDFDNILCALSQLDPKKYAVQDWSGRDFPKSLIKVFSLSTSTWIDIYHFAIEPEKKEIQFVLSLERNVFFPEWWKIRERRFTVPTPFSEVFPLLKGDFDGIEVFLPHNPEKYLQNRYGENLAPAKLYNPKTGQYEKDLSHPYWQRPYVH